MIINSSVIDIAGLVKGASKGEGLGNQFLSHIREVDAIINVVRCFEDGNITHVEGAIDPMRDIELIQTELILADLETLEKRLSNLEKKSKSEKEAKIQLELAKKIIAILSAGKPAIALSDGNEEEKKSIKNLQLITYKPQIYVCNLAESEILSGNKYSALVADFGEKNNFAILKISASIEAEIAAFNASEKGDFLTAIGLSETGLSQIIRASYNILDLITFFTVGPKECHAWNVKNGSAAPRAAGVIHTDFEKGFIRAEAISYQDYINFSGEEGCKAAGKLRLEGKDYIVSDGDIFHFRFNI